jgi:HK97 gp10 family phage protein
MKGRDKHIRRLKNLGGGEVIKAASRVLFVGADMVKAEAQRSITAGAVSGKNHVASRPGEPPNNDTGVLKNNIETTQPNPLLAKVTSSAPYAAAQERGTSRMGARPYIRPARDKMAPRIQKLFATEIDKLVKRSGR